MADPTRLVPQTGTGANLVSKLQDEVTGLWKAAAIILQNVAGTGNAITADLVPAAVGGTIVDGMSFWLVPANDNTGSVTIAINGGTPIPVVRANGEALTDDALIAGAPYLMVMVGGEFRIVSAGAGSTPSYNIRSFSASGSYSKPAGLVRARVRVRAAGGGSGGRASNAPQTGPGGGGGGGGEAVLVIDADDIPSTVTITVGSGGSQGSNNAAGQGGNGGNSSFGSLCVATGGAGGQTYSGTQTSALPGAGGGGTVGTYLFRGESGKLGGQGAANTGEGGGTATGGFAPPSRTTNGNGLSPPDNSGAGATGGLNSGSSTSVGAVGASGYVEIEEFF